MKIYKDHSLTFVFVDDGTFNEILVLKSLYSKLLKEANTAGFKKKFNPDEVELIKATFEAVEKEFSENRDSK